MLKKLFFLDFFDLFLKRFHVLLREHEQEADRKQKAGDPDCPRPKRGDAEDAERGADSKHQDDAPVTKGFLKICSILCFPVGTQGFHSAAQIADTHGAGKGIAFDLAEGLYLHRTGKGNDAVGDQVTGFRHETHREQNRNFKEQDELPPVNSGSALVAETKQLRCRDAEREKRQRNEILQSLRPVPLRNALAQKNNITGLRIREDVPAVDIGVSVLQSSGQG